MVELNDVLCVISNLDWGTLCSSMMQMLAPFGLMQDPTVTVKAIFTSAGFEESTTDEDVGIVLDSTSFYAEQGGQVNYLPLIFLVS